MDDLIVIAFPDDQHRAAEVLHELRRSDVESPLELDDAVVVTRDMRGRVHLDQSIELSPRGARKGAFWGLLVGIVLALPFPFLGPMFVAGAAAGGTAVGAGLGAMFSSPSEAGVDNDFAREVSENLPEGSSAIFLMVSGISLDDVLPMLAPYGGKLLQTTLAPEGQEKIQRALDSGSA